VSTAIVTTNLTKRYGDLAAVDGLSLSVARGTVFGLIGPNGAGKTTTFAILASLLAPTEGNVRVLGIDPTVDPFALRPRLGYVPDVLGVYDNTGVSEYLRFFAAAYHLPRGRWASQVDRVLELVDLTEKRTAMVNTLSRGMKQRLSLGRALLHDPDLLILDEPASGLDPRARVDLRALLNRLRTEGKTIVISSHILSELEDLCDEVAIMQHGKLLADGPPRQILEQLGGARVLRVRLAGGVTRTVTVRDEGQQAALLHRMVVNEGLAVVEFTQVDAGLEALFLRLTDDPTSNGRGESSDKTVNESDGAARSTRAGSEARSEGREPKPEGRKP